MSEEEEEFCTSRTGNLQGEEDKSGAAFSACLVHRETIKVKRESGIKSSIEIRRIATKNRFVSLSLTLTLMIERIAVCHPLILSLLLRHFFFISQPIVSSSGLFHLYFFISHFYPVIYFPLYLCHFILGTHCESFYLCPPPRFPLFVSSVSPDEPASSSITSTCCKPRLLRLRQPLPVWLSASWQALYSAVLVLIGWEGSELSWETIDQYYWTAINQGLVWAGDCQADMESRSLSV